MTALAAPVPQSSGRAPRFGWAAAVAWLVLIVAAQSVLFWLFLPHDQKPDQDWVLAYNGLLLNAGLPQEYFGHSGYGYFLLLWPWYALLHLFGLLPAAAFTDLPPATEYAAYQLAWQQIIEAGRALTLVMMAVFTAIFALLTAWLFADRRIGFLAGLALATSAGMASQIGIMRTEPISSLCTVAAVLAVALAAAGRWPRGRFFLLGLAGFLAVLAVLAKVFAILPLIALPAIAILFGTPSPPAEESAARKRAMILAVVAVVLAVPAAMIVYTGLSKVDLGIYKYHPLGSGPLADYQLLLVFWIAGCMALYAWLWRATVADAIAAAAAVVIGTSLGLLVLLVRYDLQNVIASVHPIEHLFVFSTWTDPTLNQQPAVLGGAIFGKLIAAAATILADHVRDPLGDNLFLLDWFVLLALAFGVSDRDRRWAAQAAALLLLSFALQMTFLLRYSNKTYHIYSDPFTIMAAAVVLNRFRSSLATYVGSAVVVVALAGYAYWGIGETVRLSRLAPDDPTETCDSRATYLTRIESLPYCPPGRERTGN